MQLTQTQIAKLAELLGAGATSALAANAAGIEESRLSEALRTNSELQQAVQHCMTVYADKDFAHRQTIRKLKDGLLNKALEFVDEVNSTQEALRALAMLRQYEEPSAAQLVALSHQQHTLGTTETVKLHLPKSAQIQINLTLGDNQSIIAVGQGENERQLVTLDMEQTHTLLTHLPAEDDDDESANQSKLYPARAAAHTQANQPSRASSTESVGATTREPICTPTNFQWVCTDDVDF
jgi:hypothetical protein